MTNRVGEERKGQAQAIGPVSEGFNIVTADARDAGVEAVIEIQVSLVTLHFPRSDRGECSREESQDKMMSTVIAAVVVSQVILAGGQREGR